MLPRDVAILIELPFFLKIKETQGSDSEPMLTYPKEGRLKPVFATNVGTPLAGAKFASSWVLELDGEQKLRSPV